MSFLRTLLNSTVVGEKMRGVFSGQIQGNKLLMKKTENLTGHFACIKVHN